MPLNHPIKESNCLKSLDVTCTPSKRSMKIYPKLLQTMLLADANIFFEPFATIISIRLTHHSLLFFIECNIIFYWIYASVLSIHFHREIDVNRSDNVWVQSHCYVHYKVEVSHRSNNHGSVARWMQNVPETGDLSLATALIGPVDLPS